jgi:hypothetical protein
LDQPQVPSERFGVILERLLRLWTGYPKMRRFEREA